MGQGFVIAAIDLAGLALIASVMAILLGTPAAAQQARFPDASAIIAFQRAADSYAFLHRQIERQIGMEHRRAGTPQQHIDAVELAEAIVARRVTPSPLFEPAVVSVFRSLAAQAIRAPGCDAGELRTGVWEMRHTIHSPATGSEPLAACVAAVLPDLPDELEYRTAGTVLLLVDTHANLVVDVLPALLAGSDLRDDGR
jgi:hypothetical protein